MRRRSCGIRRRPRGCSAPQLEDSTRSQTCPGAEVGQSEDKPAARDGEVVVVTNVHVHTAKHAGSGGNDVPLNRPDRGWPAFAEELGEDAAVVGMRRQRREHHSLGENPRDFDAERRQLLGPCDHGRILRDAWGNAISSCAFAMSSTTAAPSAAVLTGGSPPREVVDERSQLGKQRQLPGDRKPRRLPPGWSRVAHEKRVCVAAVEHGAALLADEPKLASAAGRGSGHLETDPRGVAEQHRRSDESSANHLGRCYARRRQVAEDLEHDREVVREVRP